MLLKGGIATPSTPPLDPPLVSVISNQLEDQWNHHHAKNQMSSSFLEM